MVAGQRKVFRSCFWWSASPQMASFSFIHVPYQVPGRPREPFTKTYTCDVFYSRDLSMGYNISWHHADVTLALTQEKGTESRWSVQSLSRTVPNWFPAWGYVNSSKDNTDRVWSMITEDNGCIHSATYTSQWLYKTWDEDTSFEIAAVITFSELKLLLDKSILFFAITIAGVRPTKHHSLDTETDYGTTAESMCLLGVYMTFKGNCLCLLGHIHGAGKFLASSLLLHRMLIPWKNTIHDKLFPPLLESGPCHCNPSLCHLQKWFSTLKAAKRSRWKLWLIHHVKVFPLRSEQKEYIPLVLCGLY